MARGKLIIIIIIIITILSINNLFDMKNLYIRIISIASWQIQFQLHVEVLDFLCVF